MSKRIRTKVFCYCKKCNGALVDPRTKLKHTSKYQSSIADPSSADAELSDAKPAINYDEMEWDPIERLSERNNIFLTKKLSYESAKRKGKISALVLENILDDESDKNDDDHYYPDSEEEEYYDDDEEEEKEEEVDR